MGHKPWDRPWKRTEKAREKREWEAEREDVLRSLHELAEYTTDLHEAEDERRALSPSSCETVTLGPWSIP